MLPEKMFRRSLDQEQQQEEEEQEQQQEEQGGRETLLRDVSSRKKRGWSRSCRGRLQVRRTRGGGGGGGGGGGWAKGRSHPHHPHHHHPPQRHHPHYHHSRHFRRRLSLRPVNVKGNRAKGMRAPENTNQFLMHEKYQMLHMRSDSVGSDSGSGSDSDVELTDMDSYLGVLENARGALLDGPGPHAPRRLLVLREDGAGARAQEDSAQYFPSEDDAVQTQNFMQRDFVAFCDVLAP